MIQTLGDFIELPASQEYLIIGFSPSSIPLQQRWRNNGLSADFMAEYLATFFPGNEDDSSTIERQAEIKSAVSYIANELLENAMKFNNETSEYPINIKLQLESDGVIFSVANSISPQGVDKFQAYIQQLLVSEPSELYIQQLEKNAVEESCTDSGLGLLTMLTDYTAKIGWKFQTVHQDPEVIAVTTMVQLRL
ncbi:DUF6272 family protein [Microcoleus sp. AR_TQ3_B6]|uniref:DUF6272 family protein n=1 Tax=Microcoleus sp. AR_TQ3_B6 TaxID=3055284 RepID=UPI002FD788D6